MGNTSGSSKYSFSQISLKDITADEIRKQDNQSLFRYCRLLDCPALMIKRKKVTGEVLLMLEKEDLRLLGLSREVIDHVLSLNNTKMVWMRMNIIFLF